NVQCEATSCRWHLDTARLAREYRLVIRQRPCAWHVRVANGRTVLRGVRQYISRQVQLRAPQSHAATARSSAAWRVRRDQGRPSAAAQHDLLTCDCIEQRLRARHTVT